MRCAYYSNELTGMPTICPICTDDITYGAANVREKRSLMGASNFMAVVGAIAISTIGYYNNGANFTTNNYFILMSVGAVGGFYTVPILNMFIPRPNMINKYNNLIYFILALNLIFLNSQAKADIALNPDGAVGEIYCQNQDVTNLKTKDVSSVNNAISYSIKFNGTTAIMSYGRKKYILSNYTVAKKDIFSYDVQSDEFFKSVGFGIVSKENILIQLNATNYLFSGICNRRYR